jgi:mRNA interferase MazF
VVSQVAPDRGDLVWIDFTPQSGREQAGRRPGLVLSRRVYNQRSGLALVCPVTSRRKGYPFEVALPDVGPVRGVVLADHVRSLDWTTRAAQPAGRAPPAVVDAVLARARLLLA